MILVSIFRVILQHLHAFIIFNMYMIFLFNMSGYFLCGCLTGFVCRDRRSRTPPPLEGQLEAEWHRTRTGCVCRCDRPCVCTDPSLRGRPRKACSPGSPPRCPRHSSPLCSFSARRQKDDRTEGGDILSWYYVVLHLVILFHRHRFGSSSGWRGAQ